MATWLRAQMRVAEGLLEAVDKTVSSISGIAPSADDDGGGDGSIGGERGPVLAMVDASG